MSNSHAYNTFIASQTIGYEQWHEGIGYDMVAFARMTPEERDGVAAAIRAKADPDWRDMDVLGAHGSRESIERLRDLLTHESIECRAWALGVLIDTGHTPGSVADVQLAHIIDAVNDDDGLTPALLLALEHVGPLTRLSLLRGAQNRPEVALHFAAALMDLDNLSDDMAAFDPRFRPLLLRLLPANAEPDRAAAFAQICGLLRIDPASIPESGMGHDIAWAEKMWPRST